MKRISILHKIRNTTIDMPISYNKTYNDIWSGMLAVKKEDGNMLNAAEMMMIMMYFAMIWYFLFTTG